MVLKDVKVYLSGPIEHDSTDRNWRIGPTNELTNKFGLNVFDPFIDPKQQWVQKLQQARKERDFELIEKIAQSFVQKDLSEVDRTDILIAYLPSKIPTTGTTHEIIEANHDKKLVLLVSDGKKEHIPLWFFGFISHKNMFDNWEQLYDYLNEINQGLHKENKRLARIYKLI